MFKREDSEQGLSAEAIEYGNQTLVELVEKDTDGDGIEDWEERLWGTNPLLAETNPGTPDAVAIGQIKSTQGIDTDNSDYLGLTETDKFSQELLSTVASLSQTGTIDAFTADSIGAELAKQIATTQTIQKVFTLADLKSVKNDSFTVLAEYNSTLENMYQKHPMNVSVLDALQKFVGDGETIDTSALFELNSITKTLENIINDLVTMPVPKSLASLHLEMVNAVQRLNESINNIKLMESDPIVALGAVSQYDANAQYLSEIAEKLTNELTVKLNN